MNEIKCKVCGAICGNDVHEGFCLECGHPFGLRLGQGERRKQQDKANDLPLDHDKA